MSSKRRVPKSGFRDVQGLDLGYITHTLRDEWHLEKPGDSRHYTAARTYLTNQALPEHGLSDEDLAARAAFHYVDVRQGIARQPGGPSPSQTASELVKADFAPGREVDAARLQEIHLGIDLGKLALRSTA